MAPRPRKFPTALPEIIPVFPLEGALLLPRGQIPLNVFEPRYLAMVDDALAGKRIIGLIQPKEDADDDFPQLRSVGCAGRITGFSETDDGRYLITLTGLARFRILEEVPTRTPYRVCRVTAEPFRADFDISGEADVDREQLLSAFRAYLAAHDLEADWDSVAKASNGWCSHPRITSSASIRGSVASEWTSRCGRIPATALARRSARLWPRSTPTSTGCA